MTAPATISRTNLKKALAKALKDPASLSQVEIRALCGSALSRRKGRKRK